MGVAVLLAIDASVERDSLKAICFVLTGILTGTHVLAGGLCTSEVDPKNWTGT